ncbi:unnamed protein product [Vitrella brassicaformis CCMP3155]|uniref:Uncharacterized protein n=1 Tax=Vitrella brassicaformis (strain CCMP3155) TaxID=1169540 RepID=A0A0G4EVN6_VITBC|nr:unnamed protein product [Vitrella brassicaformis CCMP3155]|eukprot:CEM02359.1 unnamed protein product [Vitrella brassicaformis CCMP3155]
MSTPVSPGHVWAAARSMMASPTESVTSTGILVRIEVEADGEPLGLRISAMRIGAEGASAVQSSSGVRPAHMASKTALRAANESPSLQ